MTISEEEGMAMYEKSGRAQSDRDEEAKALLRRERYNAYIEGLARLADESSPESPWWIGFAVTLAYFAGLLLMGVLLHPVAHDWVAHDWLWLVLVAIIMPGQMVLPGIVFLMLMKWE